ncbi:bifunctional 4-hydroxy-3-methylbut-2-enyl diphosphate reductase/30S ribosomal protein S1 [Natranaerofaba carboxydovora]|uniref:bifunctional 4-hydroxy-3-methylbut-2-enyl diphosphate reductase/30S ribosomal protein S1 n=1 Tax=Natranaerofaba carboxydovora TaxID=2742683 RepID=UPI001F13CEC7|nr:bifunctional 4-hydroxy-3-methylbut-2-enyl diphosphate reductase/30S ribosomal protein S1 [Natranaerofaba carboxydovora]UMZ73892.1 30S ribosomal protein S1 [Natranaerofaba carboxydovora]
MEVIIAEKAGFCQGVKSALDKTYNQVENDNTVFTYGPLVHNKQVVDDLKSKGVKTIEEIDDLEPGSSLVIRSHGVGPEVFREAKEKNIEIIDATCPFVKKVQKKANELYNKGYQVFIIGDPNHPEVSAIHKWTYKKGIIINHKEIAKWIKVRNKSAIVCQTTFRKFDFNQIVSALKDKNPAIQVNETICDATSVRQESARILAREVDIMIVIGGYNSSNTRKLKELSLKEGVQTYHIEKANDINPKWFINSNKIGLTAGASTPDWIIKEVIDKMSEYQNEQAKDKLENNSFEKDQLVDGEIVKILDTKAFVDIGHKKEAILPHSEVYTKPDESLNDIFNEGEKIEAKILKIETSRDEGEEEEETVIISKKLVEKEKVWEWLEKIYENGEIIESEVVEEVKGGLIVYLNGLRGFIPASLVERFYVPDLSQYVGKTLRLKVIELDRSRNKVLLSHKDVLDEEYEQKKREVLDKIEEDSIIEGEVKRVTDFGAFIDVGGIDGLCHISEISFDRVEHPTDVLQVGDKVKVKVLNVDKEKEKIALSLKKAMPDPWEKVSEEFNPGDIVEGKVTRTVDFGAFIEVMSGVEGLCHISQLAHEHVAKTEDVVKEGDKIKVKILDINLEQKRVSLSLKEVNPLEKNEPKEQKNNKADEDKIEEDDGSVKLGEVFGNVLKEFKEDDDK